MLSILGFTDNLRNIILLKECGENMEQTIDLLLLQGKRRSLTMLTNRPSKSNRTHSHFGPLRDKSAIELGILHGKGYTDDDINMAAFEHLGPCPAERVIETLSLYGYKTISQSHALGTTADHPTLIKSDEAKLQMLQDLGFPNLVRNKSCLVENDGNFERIVNCLLHSKFNRLSAEAKSPKTPLSASSIMPGFLRFGRKQYTSSEGKFVSELELLHALGYVDDTANFYALDSQAINCVTVEKAIEILKNFGIEPPAPAPSLSISATNSVTNFIHNCSHSADELSLNSSKRSTEKVHGAEAQQRPKSRRYREEIITLHGLGYCDDIANFRVLDSQKSSLISLDKVIEALKILGQEPVMKGHGVTKSMPSICEVAPRVFVSIKTDENGHNLLEPSTPNEGDSKISPHETFEGKMERIRLQGFLDRNQCKEALEKAEGNVDLAVSILLKLRFRKSAVQQFQRVDRKYSSTLLLKDSNVELALDASTASINRDLTPMHSKNNSNASVAKRGTTPSIANSEIDIANIFDEDLEGYNASSRVQDYIFQKQLQQLQERGFDNEALNMQILDKSHGELEDAMEMLRRFGCRPKSKLMIRKPATNSNSSSDLSSNSLEDLSMGNHSCTNSVDENASKLMKSFGKFKEWKRQKSFEKRVQADTDVSNPEVSPTQIPHVSQDSSSESSPTKAKRKQNSGILKVRGGDLGVGAAGAVKADGGAEGLKLLRRGKSLSGKARVMTKFDESPSASKTTSTKRILKTLSFIQPRQQNNNKYTYT